MPEPAQPRWTVWVYRLRAVKAYDYRPHEEVDPPRLFASLHEAIGYKTSVEGAHHIDILDPAGRVYEPLRYNHPQRTRETK